MAMKSWVASANRVDCDFPLENLPYGVFRHGQQTAIGIAIGDQILDLQACVQRGLLPGLKHDASAHAPKNL